jgi:hypothetical protein
MVFVGIMAYSLHACMYAFDPGFQIEESYTWLYDIFEYLITFVVSLIVIILSLFMFRVWISWPTIIQRHKVSFQFSLYFIFCFFVCKFISK